MIGPLSHLKPTRPLNGLSTAPSVPSTKKPVEGAPSLTTDSSSISRASETKLSPPSSDPLTLSDLKAKPSPLESGRLVEVVGDWCRYGGSLYDHLTGKSPRLEPGKDYALKQDGSIDLVSYKAVRDRTVEAWGTDPAVQTRFQNFEALCRNNREQISFQRREVAIFEGGRLVQKQRYTTPFFRENGWLYYESNYCDTNTGSMRQPAREDSAYRVYMTVPQDKITPAFGNAINQLNKVPGLRKHGFQAKTADVEGLDTIEKSKIMNQKDQIVFYFGENGMKDALPVFSQLAEDNPEWFSTPGVLLAKPLSRRDGSQVEGIRVASEVHGLGRSFSEVHSGLLEGCLDQISAAIHHPTTLEKLKTKHPEIAERLQRLGPKPNTQQVLSSVISDEQGKSFLAKQLEANYPSWAGRRGLSAENPAFR